MKKYNKGEWSEIYVFLKGLIDGRFYLKDSDENSLEVFHKINKIYRKANNSDKEKIFEPDSIEKNSYRKEMKYLFNEILTKKETTFSIPRIEEFAQQEDFSLSKGSSNEKGDLKAEIEFKETIFPEILYSIKSKITSSATLLNASSATNFEYSVKNLTEYEIKEINSINSRTKLKDKMEKIKEYQGIIEFKDVINKTFSDNLRYIDSELKNILAELLLLSYSSKSKKILDLTKIIEEENFLKIDLINYPRFYKDKIIKFLLEVTFNMMPNTPMDSSINLIFGGILYVLNDGEVYLIDNLIYKHLGEYLFNNLKLDSPSSTRYNMLDIKDNKFTLNLQIRFI